MKAKKQKRSPLVAKVGGYGTPAVWLTHALWLTIRGGVLRGYMEQRECTGKRMARRLVKKHRVDDEWPFDLSHAAEALDFYRIGFDAHCRKYLATDDADLAGCTPERVVELGDRAEAKAMAHELARLSGNPSIFDWRAAA